MKDRNKKNKLQYNQFILLILLTTITIMGALYISFSVIQLIDNEGSSINTIIAEVIPPKEDEEDPKDNDDDEPDIIISYIENNYIPNPNPVTPGENTQIENGINLSDQNPITDDVGRNFTGEKYIFDFKLYFNQNALGARYEITAEQLSYSTLSPRLAKIYLESDGYPVGLTINDSNKVKVYSEFSNSTFGKRNDTEKTIYSGYVTNADIRNAGKNFRLRMWVADTILPTDDVLNKKFGVRINVYAVAE